jgi:hypothetical protein
MVLATQIASGGRFCQRRRSLEFDTHTFAPDPISKRRFIPVFATFVSNDSRFVLRFEVYLHRRTVKRPKLCTAVALLLVLKLILRPPSTLTLEILHSGSHCRSNTTSAHDIQCASEGFVDSGCLPKILRFCWRCRSM